MNRNPEDYLMVKEHDWYFTPSDGMCTRYLSHYGLSTANTDFLKELSRFFYYQMVDDKGYIKDEYKSGEGLPEDVEMSEVADKQNFFEEVFGMYIPGYSPVERAANLLKMMEMNKPTGKRGEKETLSDKLPRLRINIPDKETFESTEHNKLLNSRSLEKFEKRITHLNRVGLVENFGKSFEIKKTTEERRVPTSAKTKSLRISEYSEVVKSPIYQRIFPNYTQKLLTKDLMVTAPIKTEESKQKIIILVDFSGSMHCEFKQDWVLAILADRLAYAMKEECEIFFAFFITQLLQKFSGGKTFYHVYNEQTALEFFSRLDIHPNGGDTYIGEVIKDIKRRVDESGGKRLYNLTNLNFLKEPPEILVINDGEDTCKVDNFSWKTNAITLDSHNEELKRLCIASGGRYITINGKNEITGS